MLQNTSTRGTHIRWYMFFREPSHWHIWDVEHLGRLVFSLSTKQINTIPLVSTPHPTLRRIMQIISFSANRVEFLKTKIFARSQSYIVLVLLDLLFLHFVKYQEGGWFSPLRVFTSAVGFLRRLPYFFSHVRLNEPPTLCFTLSFRIWS